MMGKVTICVLDHKPKTIVLSVTKVTWIFLSSAEDQRWEYQHF